MIEDQIDDMTQTVDTLLDGGNYDVEVGRDVAAYLRTFSDDLAAILNNSGYEEFVGGYVSAEREAFRRDDGGRTRPLCTCDSAFCALKEGRLHPRLRNADNLDKAIEHWKQDHEGHPTVLEDAREEWQTTRGDVYDALRVALIALRRGQRIESFPNRPRFEVPDAEDGRGEEAKA